MKKAKNTNRFEGCEIYEAKAAELGKRAFLNGLKCVPHFDKELKELFAETRQNVEDLPFFYTIPLMDAWIKAWTKENLSTPVNFE